MEKWCFTPGYIILSNGFIDRLYRNDHYGCSMTHAHIYA
jgi:hypothetical protein